MRLGSFVSAPITATFVQEVPLERNIIGIVAACAAAGLVVILLLMAVCLLHKRRLQQKKQFKHYMLQVGYYMFVGNYVWAMGEREEREGEVAGWMRDVR